MVYTGRRVAAITKVLEAWERLQGNLAIIIKVLTTITRNTYGFPGSERLQAVQWGQPSRQILLRASGIGRLKPEGHWSMDAVLQIRTQSSKQRTARTGASFASGIPSPFQRVA